jgi:hypothetical protein
LTTARTPFKAAYDSLKGWRYFIGVIPPHAVLADDERKTDIYRHEENGSVDPPPVHCLTIVNSSLPYRRLAFLPAPPPLGLFGGEGRLVRRGSICASTEPAKDCTCLFDSRAGSAKPIPASRLNLREVFGDGGDLRGVLAMMELRSKQPPSYSMVLVFPQQNVGRDDPFPATQCSRPLPAIPQC